MSNQEFPELTLSTWEASRDTLQIYLQVLGKIRRALTPPQKHWWHVSLETSAVGLTTGPIPANGRSFDLEIDLFNHECTVRTSDGSEDSISLDGQPISEFTDDVLEVLDDFGIEFKLDKSPFSDSEEREYEDSAIENYWHALSQIDAILKAFKGELRGETGPVVLWPHHLDLAFLWFSGRLIPGKDPSDPEQSDEQMNFGFSTGDGSIPDAYFYITAYPQPDRFTEIELPQPAYWHTEGFTAAILRYADFRAAPNPKMLLLNFLRSVHSATKKQMN